VTSYKKPDPVTQRVFPWRTILYQISSRSHSNRSPPQEQQ